RCGGYYDDQRRCFRDFGISAQSLDARPKPMNVGKQAKSDQREAECCRLSSKRFTEQSGLTTWQAANAEVEKPGMTCDRTVCPPKNKGQGHSNAVTPCSYRTALGWLC